MSSDGVPACLWAALLPRVLTASPAPRGVGRSPVQTLVRGPAVQAEGLPGLPPSLQANSGTNDKCGHNSPAFPTHY